jgi:hypothetical protein
MRLIFLLFCFFLFTACQERCVYNSQCANQEICREGICLKECKTYLSCASNEACVEGACEVPPVGYCAAQSATDGYLVCEPEIKDMSELKDMMAKDANVKDMKIKDDGVDRQVSDDGLDRQLSDDGLDRQLSDDGLDGHLDQDLNKSDQGLDQQILMLDQQLSDQAIVRIDQMIRPQSNTPWLYTEGNRIYQPGRVSWMGRGVNLHDTRSCNACSWTPANVNEVLRRIDEAVNVWGAKLLRLNLENYAAGNGRVQWQNLLNDPAYLSDIQRIVHYVGSQYPGVYIMLVPWEEPSLTSEGWPSTTTRQILMKLVDIFYDTPQVIFAVSHEPRQNLDGAQDSACWEAMNQAVSSIRDQERQLGPYRHLIAVQGTRAQGRDLNYYRTHPITAGGGENIIYEAHIYNQPVDFDRLLDQVVSELPVVVGAFGPNDSPSDQMTLEDSQALLQWMENRQVPWTAWTFHMRCRSTALLIDQSQGGCGLNMPLIPSAWGQVIQSTLQRFR